MDAVQLPDLGASLQKRPYWEPLWLDVGPPCVDLSVAQGLSELPPDLVPLIAAIGGAVGAPPSFMDYWGKATVIVDDGLVRHSAAIGVPVEGW